jgi:lipopolysaccharide/colanic/teichoic acid biosynthesis glycosyltransferase
MDAKRVLDLALGSAGLAIAAPILAGVRMAMWLSGDHGPFLYRCARIGEGTVEFTLLKVRTMKQGSEGSRVTIAADPRVTRLGRILRRYRIDELPQLLNVVRGEMSLVGPRPEDPVYVDLSNPTHRRVFNTKPGVTGLAQLEYHDEARLLVGDDADRRYREEILPAKLRLDMQYLDQRSTRLDLEILARTVRALLR